jgi:hypothetical protein
VTDVDTSGIVFSIGVVAVGVVFDGGGVDRGVVVTGVDAGRREDEADGLDEGWGDGVGVWEGSSSLEDGEGVSGEDGSGGSSELGSGDGVGEGVGVGVGEGELPVPLGCCLLPWCRYSLMPSMRKSSRLKADDSVTSAKSANSSHEWRIVLSMLW